MVSSSQDQLSLIELAKLQLEESKVQSALLHKLASEQQATRELLAGLACQFEGFTNGGQPLKTIVPSPMLLSYLALIQGSIGQRLTKENPDIAELLKGCIVYAKNCLVELDAYQSISLQEGRDLLARELEFANDPWAKDADPN